MGAILDIKDWQETYAQILWLRRKGVKNSDYLRIIGDWLDARRLVGYKIMDTLIKDCEERKKNQDRVCDPLHPSYFSVLSSISVEEFKKMRAYYIWKERYHESPVNDAKTLSIYREACHQIENCKNNCLNLHENKLPIKMIEFIQESNQKYRDKIIMRKVHWGNLNNGMCSDYLSTEKASREYVDAIYNNPLLYKEVNTKKNSKQISNIIDTINNGHSFTNLFEYCMRCDLMKMIN